MTVRGGREPGAGGRRGAEEGSQVDRRFVDRGWDDYWPDDAEAAADKAAAYRTTRRREGYESRDYRSAGRGARSPS